MFDSHLIVQIIIGVVSGLFTAGGVIWAARGVLAGFDRRIAVLENSDKWMRESFQQLTQTMDGKLGEMQKDVRDMRNWLMSSKPGK